MKLKLVIVEINNKITKAYACIIQNISEKILMPIITKKVLKETTIYTDCMLTYNSLKKYGYNHKNVNHSLWFVDPVTNNHIHSLQKLLEQSPITANSHSKLALKITFRSKYQSLVMFRSKRFRSK